MSLPLFPSLLVLAAPEFGKVIGDQRMVVPTLASSVYRRDTVPSKARLASRNSITSFEVIAGFCTAAVVLVIDVEPMVYLRTVSGSSLHSKLKPQSGSLMS